MSVDILLKDVEWDGINKIRVPLEGGGTQDFSIGGGSANLQTKSKTYTPTTSQQTDTVSPDSGYDGLSRVNVTVNAVSSGSVVSEISYTDDEPSITVDNSGIVHVSGGYSATTHPVSTSGWIDSSATTEVEIGVMGTYQLPTQGATTITPTTSQQTAVTSGKYTTGAVVVSAMPTGSAGTPTATKGSVSNHSVSVTPSVTNTTGYITGGTKTGTSVSVSASELVSGSETKTSNGTYDVTNLSEIVVNVPTGSNLQTKYATVTPSTSQQIENVRPDTGYDGLERAVVTVEAMPSGTEGTPTLIKRTASANSVSITPKVTNTAGYIPGTTKTGTAMTVSASELVSGTKSITANGTGIDVTNYASVDVNVPSGTPTLQTKSATYTPTTSQQTDTITPDTGYDGLDEVDITINAVPTGSVTMPSTISTSGGTTHYTTHNTLVITASATATPNVTAAGYISAGTSGATTLLVNTNIPTISTATINPATTDQTIPDNRYILGTQTIKAVTTNNIIASNIKSGVTVEVGDADDPDRVLSVTGTYSGGTSTCDTKTMTNSDSQATSIEFTGLSGEPKWFFVRCTSQLTRSSSYSYYFVTDIRYNGTNHNGNYYRRSNGTYYNDTSHYSHTYSNGTLTVSSSANRGAAGGSFYNGNYELVYIY